MSDAPAISVDLAERLRRARLVALDVDGTLTDGRIQYVGADELVSFDVRDGLGIARLLREGVEVCWITGRGCRATEVRAAELGVKRVHVRVRDKAEVLRAIREDLGIAVDETVAMGDDLPDLQLADEAGCFACPSDAAPDVRERAHFVASAAGGRGAVRELADALLRARGGTRKQPGPPATERG